MTLDHLKVKVGTIITINVVVLLLFPFSFSKFLVHKMSTVSKRSTKLLHYRELCSAVLVGKHDRSVLQYHFSAVFRCERHESVHGFFGFDFFSHDHDLSVNYFPPLLEKPFQTVRRHSIGHVADKQLMARGKVHDVFSVPVSSFLLLDYQPHSVIVVAGKQYRTVLQYCARGLGIEERYETVVDVFFHNSQTVQFAIPLEESSQHLRLYIAGYPRHKYLVTHGRIVIAVRRRAVLAKSTGN